MTSRAGSGAAALSWSLPNEHGFWTMLAASVLGALLRTGLTPTSVAAGAVALAGSVVLAGATHRRIRAQNWEQLAAIAMLALVGAAVELVSSLPLATVVAGAVARTAIFLACALLVRAAFARSSRRGRRRALELDAVAISVALVAGAGLALAEFAAEARACAVAGIISVAIALARTTAKQLKPLGITLAVITLATAVVLSL